MTRYQDQLYRSALEAVNRLRFLHGLGDPLDDLPMGERQNCIKCPVALALHAEVGSHTIVAAWCPMAPDGRRYMPLPMILEDFIRHVDAGDYPELVA